MSLNLFRQSSQSTRSYDSRLGIAQPTATAICATATHTWASRPVLEPFGICCSFFSFSYFLQLSSPFFSFSSLSSTFSALHVYNPCTTTPQTPIFTISYSSLLSSFSLGGEVVLPLHNVTLERAAQGRPGCYGFMACGYRVQL